MFSFAFLRISIFQLNISHFFSFFLPLPPHLFVFKEATHIFLKSPFLINERRISCMMNCFVNLSFMFRFCFKLLV